MKRRRRRCCPPFFPFRIGCENSGSSRERRRQDEKAKPTDPSCCLTHNNSRTEEASPPHIVVRVSAGQKIPSLHDKKKKKKTFLFILFLKCYFFPVQAVLHKQIEKQKRNSVDKQENGLRFIKMREKKLEKSTIKSIFDDRS